MRGEREKCWGCFLREIIAFCFLACRTTRCVNVCFFVSPAVHFDWHPGRLFDGFVLSLTGYLICCRICRDMCVGCNLCTFASTDICFGFRFFVVSIFAKIERKKLEKAKFILRGLEVFDWLTLCQAGIAWNVFDCLHVIGCLFVETDLYFLDFRNQIRIIEGFQIFIRKFSLSQLDSVLMHCLVSV